MWNSLAKAEKADRMKISEFSFLILLGFFDYYYGIPPLPHPKCWRKIYFLISLKTLSWKKESYLIFNSLFQITFHVGKKISLLHYISWHCMSFFQLYNLICGFIWCVYITFLRKNPFVGLKTLKSKYRYFQYYEIHLDVCLFLDCKSKKKKHFLLSLASKILVISGNIYTKLN